MKTNLAVKYPNEVTAEGGPASRITPIQELERTVMACLLWESGFYESGASIADRITELVAKCDPVEVERLAIKAREQMRLRHVPLLLVRELARHPAKPRIAGVLERVIQRADELAEFVSIYWKSQPTGKAKQAPLSKQMKLGLARAFGKFNEYHLAKYARDGAVKMRDVLFLAHPKPANDEQAALWKRLVDDKLATPDTWEVALSANADKAETFTRLITEGKLGYMALLRNLRNMQQAGVDQAIVAPALLDGAAKSKALPFRFVAAARVVPAWEPMIDEAMQKAMSGMEELRGRTVVLVDVSGSMDASLSAKSDLKRVDAACALAALVRGICKDARVFSFSNGLVEVPARSGMALIDAILKSQHHSGTYLGQSIEQAKLAVAGVDRMIVITDEQAADLVGAPAGRGYMINVATDKHGVGYDEWTHISGFSEAVVQFIQASEAVQQ